MNNKISIIPALILLALVAVFVGYFLLKSDAPESENDSNKQQITVYKSPTCGCCVQYIAYLKNNDFKVDVVSTEDTASIKNQYGISENMQSCHTAILDNYFIEGHVPIEAVNKLLANKPKIQGITLPGMPSGSPGMPGEKTENWAIYALKNNQFKEYLTL